MTNVKDVITIVKSKDGDFFEFNGLTLGKKAACLIWAEGVIKGTEDINLNIMTKIIAVNVADEIIKITLLDMAKAGKPQPSPRSFLGKMLKAYTTK